MIGVAVALECDDQVAHGAKVGLVGGARRYLRRLDAKLRRILAECLDPRLCVLAKRHARLLGTGNRLVVDVGVVHRFPHVVPAQVLERAAQHVQADVRPEIADVRAGIDGWTAGIHPNGVAVERRKRLLLPCERVIEMEH